MNDSLWGGLRYLEAGTSVVLIWPDPWLLADFDPEAAEIAAEILSGLPEDLRDPETSPGIVKAVTTILGTRGV